MDVALAKVAGVGQRLGESLRAVVAVSRAPALRRVLLAFGFAWTSEWVFLVALGVVAFNNRGATAVGVVAFVRMAPAALLAPISLAVADRFRRDQVLMYSSMVRGGAIGAATLLLATGAPLLTV
jgi:hypothetical protein